MHPLADKAADLIESHYVFPEDGRRIADHLRAAATTDATGESLEALIRQVSADLHLRVRPRPADRPDSDMGWRAHHASQAARSAGGISGVRHLGDDTGLIAVAPYLSAVDLAEPYIRAAFLLVSGVRRLIIDLRDGCGGTPESVALLLGYLLGDEPVHVQDLVNRDGDSRQFWTQPAAGRRASSTSVVVLTSARTFSGCEELAYDLQALGRGVVIGERTRGGANPMMAFRLSDDWEIGLPVERPVNVLTRSNWEGVGVVPELDCPSREALSRALAASTDPRDCRYTVDGSSREASNPTPSRSGAPGAMPSM